MPTLPAHLQARLDAGYNTFATLWKIERRDGVILRFTDHDTDIEITDDGIYTPSNAIQGSAIERLAGLKERDTEFTGVIDSELITFEDLKARRYNRAKVTITVVDYACPNDGNYNQAVYYINRLSYDGRAWKAELGGLLNLLNARAGRVHSRSCDAKLYGVRCGLIRASWETSHTVTEVLNPRRSFKVDNVPLFGDGWFDRGGAIFLTGNNTGLELEVKTQSNSLITLQDQAPLDIVLGDTLTMFPGCDHTTGPFGCAKFNNIINFQGFTDMPTNDVLIRTPGARL
jgi:uncharacterized phage protein (TIGR02218 family)